MAKRKKMKDKISFKNKGKSTKRKKGQEEEIK
jgi:hypothetical protein